MISAVDGYLRQIETPAEVREKLIDILVTRTKHNPKVDYIYVHPSPQDYEMFFADHFSLNPEILENIVKAGFKATMQALRKHTM